jgi:hypothetical protein
MRRLGIAALAVSALFTSSAVFAAEPQPVRKPVAQPVFASAIQTDSPLVRAAKLTLQSRLHPKSHVIIDSNTLVVTRWADSSPHTTTATAPELQGRSWASGNSNDAAALAAQEKGVRDQRIAAEAARQASLRQEQSYMANQDEEPYSEIIDDHVTKRLEAIPEEMKQKPPM